MTNIGEAVGFAVLDIKTEECPFEHDIPEPPDVENKLVGVGSTLGDRMRGGDSTKLYKKMKPTKKLASAPPPGEKSSHPFFNKKKCIEIQFDDNTRKKYPAKCAAHHLIPAQAALKKSSILAYMCEVDTGKETNHSYSDGLVWSDLGYDVNGKENGKWLPGSYAISGVGIGVWYPSDKVDDEDDSVVVDSLPADEYQDFLVHGKRGKIDGTNACWWYVAQAVKKCPGQFHDSHKSYSEDVVLDWLEQLFEQYEQAHDSVDNDECSKCKKRLEKIQEFGMPTPYGLVNRLNHISKRLSGYLNGKVWKINIFTSNWGLQYMKAVKSGNDDANMF